MSTDDIGGASDRLDTTPVESTSGAGQIATESTRRVISDATVNGRRPDIAHLVGALLFVAAVAWTLVSGFSNILHIVLLGIAAMNLWCVGMLAVRPPRVSIKHGVFSLRIVPTWSTPASNVTALSLDGGRLMVLFADLQLVEPTHQRAALARHFKRYGSHLQTIRRNYSLQQTRQLQEALGLPLQEHDQFAEFEETLQRLTPKVLVTPAIILINLAVFLAMLATGADPLHPRVDTMIDWGANYSPLTTGAQWWRLLTCTFLHFGLFHLLVNLWILRDIGRQVERLLGNTGFAIGYLFSGIMGSVGSILWHHTLIGAGASGAVFGVFGMLLGYVTFQRGAIPRELIREHRVSALSFLVLNVALAWEVTWIDQAAHIGGFVAGVVCGLVLGCLSVAAAQRTRRNGILAAVAVVCTGVAVLLLPNRGPDFVMIFQRIEELDQKAPALYRRELAAADAGVRASAQFLEQIRTQIVAPYGQLADDLQAITPRDEEESIRKHSLLEYLQLKREGWDLMAEAMERQDIVVKGASIEKFEAARSVLATLGVKLPEPERSIYAEVALFLLADQRAGARLVELFEARDLTNEQVAESIERSVLADWVHALERFDEAATWSPLEYSALISRLQRYGALRTQAFRLEVEARRESDEMKFHQVRELLEAAGRDQADILASGLMGQSSDDRGK